MKNQIQQIKKFRMNALTAAQSLAILLLALLSTPSMAQEKFTISGTIKDAADGEGLAGTTVIIVGTQTGAAADINGFYSIAIPAGNYQVQFSFMGYQSQTIAVVLQKNESVNIQLATEETVLQEVVVKSEKANLNVTNLQMSTTRLNMDLIRKLPSALGEVDIIKSVQMMPGVISAGEGNSSFFVRGGSADQNLVLMDEAPVYDPSHLFGLYSVFNTDVVKDVELYKGGIPTRFGGRLSSILDVRTKTGDSKKITASGGIGTLASRVMVEGPLNENTSFLISARRSYVDVFLKATNQTSDVVFYDVNAKLDWKANPKNRFSLSIYKGRDNFALDKKFDFSWGNTTGTFRWNHLFNDRLFSNTSLIASNFDYQLESKDAAQAFVWKSDMNQLALHNDLVYSVNANNEMSFGYQLSYKQFQPGKISSPPTTILFRELEMEKFYAIDHALYLDNQQRVNDRLGLSYGVRLSIFQNVGKSDVIVYDDPANNTQIIRKDTLHFGSMQNIKTYVNWEPRLSMRYTVSENSSIKMSYNRMVQNTHSVSNGTVPLPFNTWIPSGYYLKPQIADQFAIGYFHNLKANTIELSFETFYKDMKDVTDFADNANLFFNKDLITEIRQGRSWSYGAEFAATKKEGRFAGTLSYTWSKVMRQIPGVNQGNAYAANHDRRHVVNFAASYELSKKWSVGSTFTYSTGRPVTLSAGRYEIGSNNVDLITERNGYRLPAFHRLDLAVTFNPQGRKERKWKGQWVFSIYNVYGRKNPFTMYTRTAQDNNGNAIGDGSIKEARLISLFPTIPSVTYNFKF